MRSRSRAPADPLAGHGDDARAAILDAASGPLVLVGLHYRIACRMASGGKHSIRTIVVLERAGLLRRAGDERVLITSRGRTLARIVKHRRAVRAQLERGAL